MAFQPIRVKLRFGVLTSQTECDDAHGCLDSLVEKEGFFFKGLLNLQKEKRSEGKVHDASRYEGLCFFEVTHLWVVSLGNQREANISQPFLGFEKNRCVIITL